jgi:hypothetical protein
MSRDDDPRCNAEERHQGGVDRHAHHVHYDAAKESLRQIADENGMLFVLTYNYIGYPMVRQTRKISADGELWQYQARAGAISCSTG